MLKNSKGIKIFSIICYLIALTSLGFFIYELVKANGNFNSNLVLFIGLIVATVMLGLIALVLNPPKFLKRSTFTFITAIVLFALAGVALAFMIYSCVNGFVVKDCLICATVFIVGTLFGITLLQIAKQDINIEYRENKEKKEEILNKQQNRAKLTACPYCGCRLTPEDETCPNCKSKLN